MPALPARFLREARSAAALCHPNIAALYDVGESAELPWLVMEYVVLLYEMACGKHPFAGLTGHALVSAIATGSYPECKERNPGVADQIVNVVDRAMAREPAARYKNGAELAASLQNPDATRDNRPVDTTPTLAVIDFENIASSAEFDWLSTGIAETLSTDLARVRSLRIVSRSHVVRSLLRLRHTEKGVTAVEIGRSLGRRFPCRRARIRLAESPAAILRLAIRPLLTRAHETQSRCNVASFWHPH